MNDIREELAGKISQLLIAHDSLYDGFNLDLALAMKDYEISPRETSLAVIHEEVNTMLLRKFLTAKIVSGRTDRTVRYYKDSIISFLNRVQKDIPEITADDIRLYIAIRLKNDGVSDVTVGNELRNLRSFFGWLYTEELIPKNPMAKIDPIKQKKTKKDAFTELQIELIRNACKDARETAIIELLLSTGCRCGELVLMRWSELKGDKIIVHGKGRKDRLVYLNAKALVALQNYKNERRDTLDWIFPKYIGACDKEEKSLLMRSIRCDLYKHPELMKNEHADVSQIELIVRRLGKRAGVENCHPHRFRRTCATFALRRGMPIEQVSKMLGHAQLTTTQIYLDLSDQDMEQAHRKYVV